jgi:hypothetical protein
LSFEVRLMHRRASSWRVVCGLLIAATIVAACARDQITNPFGSGRQPAGPASHAIITSLGSYSIPIPASNVPGDGTVGTGPTGITVPAGTYYRVRAPAT